MARVWSRSASTATAVRGRETGEPGDKMHRGFRAARLPPAVAMERTYGPNEVRRAEVERADAAWVHGRGQDVRSRILSDKSVTVFGCGSVGSFVTESLARAGVGTLRLVDFDKLSWANVGRHALGADSVGRNKAESLAERLQRELPHLQFEGDDSTIGAALLTDEARLLRSDLVVCLTGNWVAESVVERVAREIWSRQCRSVRLDGGPCRCRDSGRNRVQGKVPGLRDRSHRDADLDRGRLAG